MDLIQYRLSTTFGDSLNHKNVAYKIPSQTSCKAKMVTYFKILKATKGNSQVNRYTTQADKPHQSAVK